MKKLAVLFFTCFLSLQISAAGGGKLIDLLLNESGLMELLTKNSIEAGTAVQVRSYVKGSLKSLTLGDSMPTKETLLTVIKNLQDTPADRRVKANLLKLLNKESDEVTKSDLVEAVNNLIFLANRHGVRGSLVLACSECVNSSLFAHGFRFTLEEVAQGPIKQLFETGVIPREPRALNQFISNRMKRLGVGKYSGRAADLVAPEEEKALAIFLALADKNSPATDVQRDYINSVLELSKTPSGEIKLLNPENPHKFWKTFDQTKNTDNILTGYTALLKEVAEEGKDSVNKEDAFYRVLRRNAGDDPKLAEDVNALKINGCYFGK